MRLSTHIFFSFILAVLSLTCCDFAQAQFSIPWFTIDAGGTYSAGAGFELEGTIGQFDAGQTMSNERIELRGGFWIGSSLQTQTIFLPEAVLITRGTHARGDVEELANDDNADLTIRRANTDVQSRTEFVVKTTSTLLDPVSLSVKLKGSVFARTEVNQTIELFNFGTGGWELIDSRLANRFTDSTVIVFATGDLSRFVDESSTAMEARIRFVSTNPRQRFSSNTDQFIWTVE